MDGDAHQPVSHQAEVDENGAITLPAAIRARLRLEAGDRVYMYPSLDRGFILRKAIEDDFTRRLESLRGIAGPGPSTDEMMEMARGAADR